LLSKLHLARILAFRPTRARMANHPGLLYSRRSPMNRAKIFPILLAAGSSRSLPFPKALAPFGNKTALEIALSNCEGLEQPIVVLGAHATEIRKQIPADVFCVVNRAWRRGQLSSLLAGLRHVPDNAAFLVYPADLPMISPGIIQRLASAFHRSSIHPCIVMPRFREHLGHPAVLSASLRDELKHAKTAREVVYRDERRIVTIPARSDVLWTDFDTWEEYVHCRSLFLNRK
jgi:molybdenum cofactor cytidylyltransferase